MKVQEDRTSRKPLEKLCYIRLHLVHDSLTSEGRRRLEHVGVECLSDGSEFEAYGVIPERPELIERITLDPEIVICTLEEPPSGK